jgi:hypothetical protein
MRSYFLAALLSACALTPAAMIAQQATVPPASAQASVITATEAAKILPPTVVFRGLSAPIQGRNAAGIRFADQKMLLVSLVDTSGYSTQVKDKYQAYLITESTVEISGQQLVPGAYGCGFIADDNFVVQDIGAHDLFTVHSIRDTTLRRPTPLQIVASPDTPGSFRLYAGRSYVTVRTGTQ